MAMCTYHVEQDSIGAIDIVVIITMCQGSGTCKINHSWSMLSPQEASSPTVPARAPRSVCTPACMRSSAGSTPYKDGLLATSIILIWHPEHGESLRQPETRRAASEGQGRSLQPYLDVAGDRMQVISAPSAPRDPRVQTPMLALRPPCGHAPTRSPKGRSGVQYGRAAGRIRSAQDDLVS